MDVDLEYGRDEDDDDEESSLESSGNLWADIGRPDAAEAHARCQLMEHIVGILRDRTLTNEQVAAVLGVTPAVAAALMGGKLGKFSISQLFAFLEVLGHDVEINVHPRKAARRVSLRRAARAR